MPDSFPKNISGLRLPLLLLLVSVLYLPSLENGYVGWDDDLILNNPFISSLSLKNLSEIFLPAPGRLASFQPMRTFSHALVFAVSGTSPKGYLILNILLYLANVWLFYILVRGLLRMHGGEWLKERSSAVSLTAAAAFALHPVHVEVVSWLQGGKQTLMAAFVLGSFILYCRYFQSRKAAAYWASVILYWAALASQPGAVSLPLVLICYEALFARNRERRSLEWWLGLGRRMLPFILPTLLLGVHLLFFSSVVRLAGPEPSLLSRIFNLPLLWSRYLVKLLLPVNLCCRYPISVPLKAPVAAGLGALFLLGAAAYLAWRAAGSNRLGLLALAWFAATALPTSGLVRTSTLMSDRYLYLPSLGFSFLLAVFIVRCLSGPQPSAGGLSRRLRQVLIALLAATAVSWAAISVQRQADWRSAPALWSRVVAVYPEHDLGHFNLAYAYQDSGDLEQAITHYRRAIEINPRYAHAYSNLGVCLRAGGREKEALLIFERARDLEPRRSEIWVNLGISYTNLGEDSLALAAFDSALALGGKAARTAYFNRAQLLFALGRPERAEADLKTAVTFYPQWLDTGAWLSIGRRLEASGKVELAVELMSRGVEQAAFDAECWRMLGNLQILAARPQEAVLSLEKAAGLEPDNPETLVLIGAASQLAGRPGQAVAAYREALERVTSGRPQLRNNLGRALIESGDFAGAEEELKAALQEDPGYLEARMNLALLYLKLDRPQQAGKQFRLILDSGGDKAEYRLLARRARMVLDSLEVH